MATTVATPPPSAGHGEASSGKRPGAFWKIMAVCFIAAVVGAECLVAFIYLRSPGGEAKDEAEVEHGENHEKEGAHGAKKGHGDGDKKEEHEDAKKEHGEKAEDKEQGGEDDEGEHGEKGGHGGDHEADLGQFSLTAYLPSSNTTLLVDFHLYGTVRSAEEHEFESLLEKHKHRIRDQVIVIIRSAELADLADPGLGLIKRQILEKSNALLGKRMLQDIIFSDFTFVEQQPDTAERIPMADEAQLGQNDIDAMLSQASALSQAGALSQTGAASAASMAENAASKGGKGAPPDTASASGSAAGANAATPAATTSPSSIASSDMEYLFQQAQDALASVDTPHNPAGAAVAPFRFEELGGAPTTMESATLELIRDVELDLTIELGRTNMLLEDVLKLRKGSVVPLDKLAGDPVDIYVNGRPIARGEVLVLNDNFCVRVAELLTADTPRQP